MNISYDPGKNEKNIAERGISFEQVVEFEWSSALIVEDSRKDYGEPRFQALGFIGKRLHALVFTPRAGLVHVISLRKANRREVKRYETQTQS
ncbi:MAG TPA: BrnT family toxin [Burkholderiales bacterium]|nr:BrnT family toxin [Burkholderiales bacterium]